MIYHNLDATENWMLESLSFTKQGDHARTRVEPFLDGYCINYQFEPKFYGNIYPMRQVKRLEKFKRTFDLREFVEYTMVGTDMMSNPDVCKSCLEQFYAADANTVFLATFNCDINLLMKCPSFKSIIFFFLVFCRHSDTIDFITEDYYLESEID